MEIIIDHPNIGVYERCEDHEKNNYDTDHRTMFFVLSATGDRSK